MESQQEKVYIAVGKNVVEGIGILKWALDHWRSQPVSFIVLHINISSKTFVETSFGKLPCSSVSDEKLEFFRAKEQQRVDKFLSKYYMALCSKVEAEVLKVEAYEEPIHQILVEQITKFGIKKLVMGFKHTRILSCRKPSSDTSDSCYVRKHKPEFCKLFIVSGGKLLLPKEENGNGVYFVDESGKIVVDFRKKPKGSLKGLFGRKQTDNASNADETIPSHCVLSPSNAEEVIHKWEEEAEEVERYIQGLLAANSLELEQGEESMHKHEVTDAKMIQSSLNRTEHLREIERAKKTVEEKKEERKAEEERRTKAEQIISMCNQHAGDIEASLRQEMAKIATLKKEHDSVREQMEILFCNMTDNNHKLTSESDKKGELLIKLQSQSTEKSWVEAEIANTERKRVVVLREMEEFRQQMGFARRKLEYYKERKAMTATNGLDYEYRDFSKEELNDATDVFSENMMIYRSSEGAVYKGKILQSSVAIKLKNADVQSLEEFKAQVNLLSHANHPHIVTMIGACTELRCIVFEYMNHGSLQSVLFPAASSFSSNQHLINLPWHSRIQIISSLCSALGFLHSSQPNPTAHGRLDSSHVLLDHNLTAKIMGIRTINSDNLAIAMDDDIKALGLLILQLLTGIREIDFQEMKQVAEAGTIEMVLDRRAAGDWPIDFALEFARIGLRCFEGDEEEGVMVTGRVMNEVEDLRVKAEHKMLHEEGGNRREEDVPSVFLCPIFQEVMKDPHVAADGFSYELEAINEWLSSGHETSPMTNLKLNNKRLIPNHILQSVIRSSRHNYS